MIGVPRARLPVRNMVMLTATTVARCLRLRRGTVTYIGTTDTTEKASQSLAGGEAADVEYLLQPIERYFPRRSSSAAMSSAPGPACAR